METALYRIPGKDAVLQQGFWHLTDFASITAPSFFITSFNKEQCYVFEPKQNFEPTKANYFCLDDHDVEETKQDYLNSVAKFKTAFKTQNIHKAIYSRIIKKESKAEPYTLFKKLCKSYPDAFVYLVSSPKFGTWLAATPEILLQASKQAFNTVALAGTKKEQSMGWTNKEIEEQALVTSYILGNLKQANVSNLNHSKTHTTNTGAVYHLKTDIRFNAVFKRWNILANALHPTPAVCGLPVVKALKLIQDTEKHPRKFYAGIVGLVNKQELNSYVNLRCMQVHKKSVSIYVGGGITPSSVAEDEYTETQNKAQTLLRVLG